MTSCTAQVRRVELAASSSDARQQGERWRGPRLPHPALSSQPQRGGVVSATRVSIIGTNLTGCSADSVRRVELAASSSAARQRDERYRGPRLPHPALSSQPQNGGVVYTSWNNVPVSISGSTVTGCSTGGVRRVELAASSSDARQQGERYRGPRLPHPALSSQPQNGGVVYASHSGAVSIIGSTVTGCSATGGVRRVELVASLQRRTAAGREMERATAASPRSPLATAGWRRRLRN